MPIHILILVSSIIGRGTGRKPYTTTERLFVSSPATLLVALSWAKCLTSLAGEMRRWKSIRRCFGLSRIIGKQETCWKICRRRATERLILVSQAGKFNAIFQYYLSNSPLTRPLKKALLYRLSVVLTKRSPGRRLLP